MKTIFAAAALSVILVSGAIAAPANTASKSAALAKTASKSAAATLKCPSCGMPMPTAKTAAMPVPIYITAKKQVYYCCAQCPSGKKAAAYYHKNHKPMHV